MLFYIFLIQFSSVASQDQTLSPAIANIQYGDVVNEQITRDGIVTFTFDGSAGDVIVISANSNDFDTFLELYSPNDDLLAFNDDFNNLNALIGPFELTLDGTYTIAVWSYWVNPSGNFALSLLTEDMIVDLSEVELIPIANEVNVSGGDLIYQFELNQGDLATTVVTAWDPIVAIIISPSGNVVGTVDFSQPFRFQASETGTYFFNVLWIAESSTTREYEVIEGCTRDGRCATNTETEFIEIPNEVSFSIAYHVQSDGSTQTTTNTTNTEEENRSMSSAATSESGDLCSSSSDTVTITLNIHEVIIYSSVEATVAFSSGGDEAVLIYGIARVSDNELDFGADFEYAAFWEADAYDGDTFSNLDGILRTINCGSDIVIVIEAQEEDFGSPRILGTEIIEFALVNSEIPTFEPNTEIRFTGQFDTAYDYGIYYTITISQEEN